MTLEDAEGYVSARNGPRMRKARQEKAPKAQVETIIYGHAQQVLPYQHISIDVEKIFF